MIVAASGAERLRLRALVRTAGLEVVDEAPRLSAVAPDLSSGVVIVADRRTAFADELRQAATRNLVLVVTDGEGWHETPPPSSQPDWSSINAAVSPHALRAAISAAAEGLIVRSRFRDEMATPVASPFRPRAKLGRTAVALAEAVRAGTAGARKDHGFSAIRPPVDELTPREREVLTLLAEGLSNRAIAARLGISRHTVKFHLAAIFGKLGASTRARAMRIALERGLLHL